MKRGTKQTTFSTYTYDLDEFKQALGIGLSDALVQVSVVLGGKVEVTTVSAAIHKATPQNTVNDQNVIDVCAVCDRVIKKVPGGHGLVWVHEDSGMVAGDGGAA